MYVFTSHRSVLREILPFRDLSWRNKIFKHEQGQFQLFKSLSWVETVTLHLDTSLLTL